MTSLYTTAWKTFLRSLLKLLLKLWSFILYLHSFSSRPAQPSFNTTSEPPLNGPSDIDLEGGRTVLLHPGPKGLPFTTTFPSPCVRRPRASTLDVNHSPCANSTPGRTDTISRSSALCLSAVENGVATDNRSSEGSLCSTVLSTWPEERISDADICYRILELDSGKLLMPSKSDETKLVRQRRQMSLPSKCLSPLKTLSLATCHLKKTPKPIPTSAPIMAFIDRASYRIRYHERSYSVDRGLSIMLGMKQRDDDSKVRSLTHEKLARRPWSIASPILDCQLSEKPSKGKVCAKSDGDTSDLISLGFNNFRREQISERCQSGFGLHDVSYVERMFSVMRENAEQDELNARNIFNRESVLAYRKSAIHSKGAEFLSQCLSVNVQHDKHFPPVNRPRTPSRRTCISQVPLRTPRYENVPTVDVPIQLDCFIKPPMEKRNPRFRYRSAAYGLDASPSMQHQLKVEKIKRQRKVRQEMMARTKLLHSRQSKRETYEWFAEDIVVQDCD